MVRIISSYTVVPSESTPKGRLWCSDIDQIVARRHIPSIYVYRQDHYCSANVIERMRDSLGKILVHFYPVTGRICFTEGGRLEVDCNEKGVTLLEAESTKTLDDYGNFEPNEKIKELVPKIDYWYSTLPIEEVPLLLVQLTRTSCGGLCVGVAVSHILVDGTAAVRFINSWAKQARGDKLDEDDMPFLDRTVLKSSDPLLTSSFDHPECKPWPLILGSSDNKDEREKETIVVLLKLTREQVERLKQKANEVTMNEDNMFHQRPYSRYEAIAAHIWRSGSKARQNDHNQPTVVGIVADIRNRLNPPLPQNYFGNAILRGVTPTCHSGDIISKPLSYAAQKMREATVQLTDEYLRSQITYLTREQNVECKHQFAGNPNMHIVSWLSMPAYEADFGWGKPVHFGPVSFLDDGRTLIMPGPAMGGSLMIATRFQITLMESFKKYFYKDI